MNASAKVEKALNASAGLGVKRNGLSMAVCNLLYWSVIIPTTLFGCELWVLTDPEIEKLQLFQRQASRHFQRFDPASPTESCFYGLGWIGLCTYICVKKMLFAHSIARLDETNVIKQVFIARAKHFREHLKDSIENKDNSPALDILRVAYNSACMRYSLITCLTAYP